jgi:D-alanyl-D-alanine carboxypeptidase/D-alanyl-D-alanine-endopeptidase (penicillin-binding protein 4)
MVPLRVYSTCSTSVNRRLPSRLTAIVARVLRRLLPSLIALLLTVTAAAPAEAVDRARLQGKLQTLHARLGPASGAMVVDLDDGRVLFSRRADASLVPASNQKLFVTAAALLELGPDHTLTTAVHPAPGAAIDASGRLKGDLYLVGGGDPTLDDAGLRALVTRLREAGLRRIDGAVVGDESLFDTLRGGPATGFRYDYWLGGGLSALSWRLGRMSAGSPALAAAKRFGALLKARGITYTRKPRAGVMPRTGAAQVPEPLATLASPPLRRIVATVNTASQNFYAEMLTKALGAHLGTGGSTAGGLKVVARRMRALGLSPRLSDGSGLSRGNRTTARQVVSLLQAMHAEQVPGWKESLPVAGVSGTLRKRMRGTAAHRACRAKTGSLNGVSSLSGYCTTPGGEVAFSVIANRVCSACAKRIEDRMVAAIARYSG